MATYTIETACPSPSMSTTTVQVDAPDYMAAVALAVASWRETGRTTYLHSGQYAVYYYHKIEASGAFVDRNTNSGVAPSGNY